MPNIQRTKLILHFPLTTLTNLLANSTNKSGLFHVTSCGLTNFFISDMMVACFADSKISKVLAV